MRISVKYDGYDVELDKKIKEFCEGLGFEWYGQGYDFIQDRRDIAFDKESYG